MCSEQWREERKRMLHLCNEESRELTRDCIEDALLRLLREKDFKDISVTDIATKAGVSRGAYYRNYESKEDIFRCIMKKKFESAYLYMRQREQGVDPYAFWCGMFERILEDLAFYQIAVKIKQEIVLLEYFNEMATHLVLGGNVSRRVSHYELLYYAGASYNVIIGWIKNGAKETPTEMAAIITPLMEEIK